MDKYPYVLGSFDKMSDVVIKAQVVSRMHCCIYHEDFKEDKYFVEDLNATNGTYLNGERLGNHEKKELHNGDILKLAAMSFIVEII
jgi:pSer/pThr/pTyr-binding forkhead associated (FHA) protein